jgi:hypothetical protein
MRYLYALALVTYLAGCGPLFLPMLPREKPEEQRRIDETWDNMLTPVPRLDRQVLLDTGVLCGLYTNGVDRMHMTSEKHFSGGTAVMEIDCDRINPDVGQFIITVYDERGRTIRRERYTRADVEESGRMMFAKLCAETQPGTARSQTPEERQFWIAVERRRAAVVSATQPARLGASEKN